MIDQRTCRRRCAANFSVMHLAALAAFVGLSAWALAQQAGCNDTPMGRRRGPLEWGPEDQRGAANRVAAEKVLEANKLIKQGRVYSLGRVYEHGMPLPGKRHFSLTIPGSPTYPPSGKNQG